MKVIIRLEIPDLVRIAWARLWKDAKVTGSGCIKKRDLVEQLERHLQAQLPEVRLPRLVRPTLSLTERAELRKVYDYMRAIGYSDGQIEEWILLQRARLDLKALFPHLRAKNDQPFESVG